LLPAPRKLQPPFPRLLTTASHATAYCCLPLPATACRCLLLCCGRAGLSKSHVPHPPNNTTSPCSSPALPAAGCPCSCPPLPAAVAVAEPEYLYRVYRTPNDPDFAAGPRRSGQWALHAISAPAAWDTTTGSREVKVCVIDSGVRSTHQDLAANIAGGWNRCACVPVWVGVCAMDGPWHGGSTSLPCHATPHSHSQQCLLQPCLPAMLVAYAPAAWLRACPFDWLCTRLAGYCCCLSPPAGPWTPAPGCSPLTALPSTATSLILTATARTRQALWVRWATTRWALQVRRRQGGCIHTCVCVCVRVAVWRPRGTAGLQHICQGAAAAEDCQRSGRVTCAAWAPRPTLLYPAPAGVAWNVSLWICKALSEPDANGNSYLYSSATQDCYALCRDVRQRARGWLGGGRGGGTWAEWMEHHLA